MRLTPKSDKYTLLLLCTYGLAKEIRPSEPYLTEYLTGDKGLDEDDVYQKIYPVWSYSYFALLVPVFLLTDLLRYKPVINLEGVAYVVTWVLLLWAEGVGAMQAMQFVYAVATSTEVAYYTYIYARVDPSKFKLVSSLTRSAILTGKFLSGTIAQIMDSLDLMSYRDLNYISLASVSIAFVVSLFLPNVKSSIYFHRELSNTDLMESGNSSEDLKSEFSEKENEDIQPDKLSVWGTLKLIFTEAKNSYKRSYVLKWSVWVAASTCLNFQVGNYIQPLWEEIQSFEEGDIYNGAVEAATTLLGAVTVLIVGFVRADWRKWGDWAILIVSGVGGAILIGMAYAETIWIAYVGYMLFRMSYQLLMTVASFEIAKEIEANTYGLIFGLNTWAALGLQTCLTITVADSAGLALPIREQFIVYGSLYIVTGACFSSYFIIRKFCCRK